MGRVFNDGWPVARRAFEVADEICDAPISKLCFEGPYEELTRTENAQPALLTVSYVCLAYARERGLEPSVVAGHSLGEYAALIAAGVCDFETALGLVSRRGKLMARAALPTDGMAAVLGLPLEKVRELISATPDLEIANINCPGQVVVSGAKCAIEASVERFKAAGARRVLPLAVSGAFHTSKMETANAELWPALEAAITHDAAVPIVQNATGRAVTKAPDLLDGLARQMTSPVLWDDVVRSIANMGVSSYVELGPGNVLKGLVERCQRGARVYGVAEPEGVYEVEELMVDA